MELVERKTHQLHTIRQRQPLPPVVDSAAGEKGCSGGGCHFGRRSPEEDSEELNPGQGKDAGGADDLLGEDGEARGGAAGGGADGEVVVGGEAKGHKGSEG